MEEELRRVLVVDPSRVVRTTLTKHLRGHFAVREEADGETAWQTLVLDPSVVAVVSGTQLPRLGSLELLARLRGKKLRRLSDIPFLLLVSGNEPDVLRTRAHECGVTDFITRGMTRDEVLERIERLVNWDLATDFLPPGAHREAAAAPMATPVTAAGTPRRTPTAPASPAPPALSEKELRQALQSALTRAAGSAGRVGVIAFRLDDQDGLAKRVGNDTVTAITAHVARVLRAKVGAADSVGCDADGRCLIVSPGTSLASCLAFAERVCRGLANSQVNVGGETFCLRVSAGIAGLPADTGHSARELIALAAARLQRAHTAGGGRVAIGDDGSDGGGPGATEPVGVELATRLAQLAGTVPAERRGRIGLELMPLLRAIEREFACDLPLRDLERVFAQRLRDAGSPT